MQLLVNPAISIADSRKQNVMNPARKIAEVNLL